MLVFVAPDGTEYPVRGVAWAGSAGVEWLVDDLTDCAERLGLKLNCGIVEVQAQKQEGTMMVCDHALVCNSKYRVLTCRHSEPHRFPVWVPLHCDLHSDARYVEVEVQNGKACQS